ncbi:MAG: glycosyltransferase [Romboutsia sp.]
MINNKILNDNPHKIIQNYDHTPIDENPTFTSIIILTYNQLEYTKLCIESIRKFTLKGSYEIIVVDNNSTDDTPNWLRKQNDLKVIYNLENKGFPAGCNQGIEISNGENILLLNNDTVVTPNWLQNLKKALYSSDTVGAVGSVSNNCSNYQQIATSYQNISEMLNFATGYNISNKSFWKYKTRLIGFCYLIKKEVLDKIGLLDEIFSPGNFEDDDLSYRIICQGYNLLLCADAFIHHFGSVSFSKNSNNFLNTFNKNSIKFKEKWGIDSGSASIIKPEILNLVNDHPDRPINILDANCGIGSSLLELKSRYKNANLYGITNSRNCAKLAKNICNCIIADIDSYILPYEEKFFDYIILDDIIEHLKDPWMSLANIKKYIKDGGYIIANIPNLMHISILSQILNGNFTYTNTGLLDKSHLRFFTLSEIDNLFMSSEYNIISKSGSLINLSKDEESLVDKLCSIYGQEFKQQYSTYQYIIKAQPNIDLQLFEQDKVFYFRKALLNIDCNKDIENSLDIIFEFYQNNIKSFDFYMNYLINNTIINKDYVSNQVASKLQLR